MSRVLVERAFSEPQVFSDLQAQEDAKQWCLVLHEVEFSHSYFSVDRKRMICVYNAPDAESVRLAQAQAGLPFERVWAAASFGRFGSTEHDPAQRLSIVERTFPMQVQKELAEQQMRDNRSCLETYSIRPVSSYFDAGSSRGLCVFVAPDLESVRLANRMAKLPADAIWAADLKRR